jgi:hypothetical protein
MYANAGKTGLSKFNISDLLLTLLMILMTPKHIFHLSIFKTKFLIKLEKLIFAYK